MDTKKVADDLYNKFYDLLFTSDFREVESKRAAILCVDEILGNIEATILYHKESKALPINKRYWTEVKEHLNNM